MACGQADVVPSTRRQLEVLGASALQRAARRLRDVLGEDRCPPGPQGRSEDILVSWILEAQDALARGPGRPEAPQAGPGATPQETATAPPPQAFAGRQPPALLGREDASGARGPLGLRCFEEKSQTHMRHVGVSDVQGADFNFESRGKRRFGACASRMVAAGTSAGDDEGVAHASRPADRRPHAAEGTHFADGGAMCGLGGGPPAAALATPPVKSLGDLGGGGGEKPRRGPRLGLPDPAKVSNVDPLAWRGTQPGEEPSCGPGRGCRGGGLLLAGSQCSLEDTDEKYRSTWKRDPYRLRGSSLVC